MDGIHGDVDAPRSGDTVVRTTKLLVGGWAISETSRAERVDVYVGDWRVLSSKVEQSRPDIAASGLFDRFEGFETAGWNGLVDLSLYPHDTIEFRAEVVRTDGAVASLKTVSCTVVDGEREQFDEKPVREGLILAPGSIAPGYQRLYAVGTAPGGISSADVLVNGVRAGKARVALPGDYMGIKREPADYAAAMEILVEIPENGGHFELGLRATGMDGIEFDLKTAEIDAVASPDKPSKARPRHYPGVVRTEANAKRLLVLTHDLGLGGGQLWLQDLLRGLKDAGYWCAVVSLAGGVLAEELESWGFAVHVMGGYPLGDPEAYEGRLAELARWIAQYDCGTALANTTLTFGGVDLAERLGMTVTWAIHESFDLELFWLEAYGPGAVHSYVKQRARQALGAAKHVVFEASATLRLYEPYLSPGAGCVVNYGVEFAEIDAYRAGHSRSLQRAALGISDDTVVMVCLGTVEPRKGQLALVLAFAGSQVLSRRRVELILVGARPGPYLTAIEDAIRHSGARITLKPVVADTYEWYNIADVFVCASDVESLPRSLIEAMAFERPILSTRVYGVPELVVDGEHGFLCDMRDLLSLRHALERAAMTLPEQLRALGRAGRARVVERHDPRYLLDATLEFLA